MVGFDNYLAYLHIHWASPIIAIALMFGVLAGVLTWVAGPSKGIFAVGKAGYLPPFFPKTNKIGVQKNILIIQGVHRYFIGLIICCHAFCPIFLSDAFTVDRIAIPDYVHADVYSSHHFTV